MDTPVCTGRPGQFVRDDARSMSVPSRTACCTVAIGTGGRARGSACACGAPETGVTTGGRQGCAAVTDGPQCEYLQVA